jgi:hypothetical protein
LAFVAAGFFALATLLAAFLAGFFAALVLIRFPF